MPQLDRLFFSATNGGQRLRRPLLITFSILWLLFVAISLYLFSSMSNQAFKNSIERQFAQVFNYYRDTIDEQATLQELALEAISADPRYITALVSQQKSEIAKSIDSVYQHLNTNHRITHLYFIAPDRRVIYRAHSPQRFGDEINRQTMDQASRQNLVVSGLEFGVLGTFTLRSVKPVYEGDKKLGYIELGMELGHVVRKTESSFGIELYEFYLKEYVQAGSSDEVFSMTGRLSDQETLPDHIMNYRQEHNSEVWPTQLVFVTAEQAKDTFIVVEDRVFKSEMVRDYSGNEIGLITASLDFTRFEEARKESYQRIIVVYSALFIAGCLLFNFLASYVERMVRSYLHEKQEQTDEIASNLVQLRTAQQQLIEKEKFASLGHMVAGVAHEINTPIGLGVTGSTALLGRTERIIQLFDEKTLKASDLKNYLEFAEENLTIVYRNLERAADLIHSFKQMAVDQSSGAEREFNFLELLNEVLLSLRPQLKKTKHIVTLECADNIDIKGKPGLWSQVIINLITNSLIHGFANQEQGEITISVTRKVRRLAFVYTDNGIGISDENAAKIFEPFFTTRRQEGGSGLGMHLVFNIVTQAFDGSIQIDKEYSSGVRFTIDVPVS